MLEQVLIILAIALPFGVSFEIGPSGIVLVALGATIYGMATACVGIIIVIKTKSTQITMGIWVLCMRLVFIATALMTKKLLSGWFKVAVAINPMD
jgi:hypothetical protein